MPELLRGEIYWADLDPVLGHEQAGRRPILILTEAQSNTRSHLAVALPITASRQRIGFPYAVRLRSVETRRPSWVLPRQIRAVSDERILTYMGMVSNNELKGVVMAVLAHLLPRGSDIAIGRLPRARFDPAVWILLAICSAASLGFANIAHKRLLDNYLDGVGVLGVGSILTRLTCAGILLAAVGWPTGASWQAIGTGLLSGISLGTGLLLLFLGLKLGEASRAVAVSQTNPILVALLALAILGEAVGPWQWTAIALVVLGAILVSVEGLGRGLFRVTPGLTALVGSSAGLGMSFFLAKLVLSDLTPWEVFALQELGMVPVFAVFGRPSNWRKLYSGLRSWPALTTFLVGEGLLPQLAILLFVWSFAFGPVSLASAVLATRPMFVFLAGTLLSWRRLGLLQESLGTSALAAKFVAIVMIVAGTTLLAVF